MNGVSRTRLGLGAVGIALGLFGVFRLLTEVPGSDLVSLFIWLLVALVLHDGVIAPLTAAVGWGLEHAVPPRARRAVVYGLAGAVAVTVVALPEIYRHGSQPPQKALLRQDYGGHLAIALGIVAAVALASYAISVVRDRAKPRPSETNPRPSDDQVSSTE
ncbi:hypothetical protein [Jatrophihabitans endophyticus]|uniref:hypothetical protein n=1 Tax=Jatrophihabitans endophyticus TaxID=1206085 RepID=UPI0019F9DF99|nr:hypothetical protein [Jatrophihabitans endophyticus]MBE7189515.1 hypothetical protein [Jatrophihabitans endophyticus]